MSSWILYLLEVSAVLATLYCLYILLMKKETFFNLNRFFLVAILAISFLIPLLSFDLSLPKQGLINEPIEELSDLRLSYYEALQDWTQQSTGSSSKEIIGDHNSQKGKVNAQSIVLWLVLSVYALGFIGLLIRLILTYRWIYKLKKTNPTKIIDGTRVVMLPQEIAPFSFLNETYASAEMMKRKEFAQILAHEKVHIREGHSIDLLFVQLLAIILWFNPVIWLLIKSLKTTHEYIADKKMIKRGYSLVEYQSLLLRQLISNNSFGLVHNFNLSFIKKRITMMKIEKSGRVGKAKVAIVLFTVIVFSLAIVQCNSKIEERTSDIIESPSGNDYSSGVNLPALPDKGYKFNGDLSNSLDFTIVDNKLTLNGQPIEVDKISTVIENSDSKTSGIIVMRVDKSQSMSVVRKVSWQLQKANRRMLLYKGKTSAGEQAEMAFLLPPAPSITAGVQMPVVDESYFRENNMEVLKVNLGEKDRAKNQQKVYEFVKDQIETGKSNYVVHASYDDDDTYNDYLINLVAVQESFNQIYQERSQEMFGKDFLDLDKNDEKEKEQYSAIIKGVPRSILVEES